MNRLLAFLRDESGVTSVEYAMIASCIAAVIVASVNNLGTTVKGNYTSVHAALTK
jgi:pilus assembly protein Flp/PilA